ncbi:MAG: BMP family ABC transporter substrate-binding protein [Actinomycetota bacterium]
MGMCSRRLAATALACTCLLLPLAACSCSDAGSPFSVALIGFGEGTAGEERNNLAEYGKRRAEAELGVDVDFILPAAGEDYGDLFSGGEDSYDLVISLGRESSLDMLSARPAGSEAAACALDFESPQTVKGEDGASLVRYRVEEGSYVCGYLAGWLTGRSDHPLTNTVPLVAFIGAKDDPLLIYYNVGFGKGVEAGLGKEGTYSYHLEKAGDSAQARAYAEEAVEDGIDIIFCTPGLFNDEVIEVAEEKDVLVILVGADRSSESPDHVLTSLVLRDDNTVFAAVAAAVDGEMAPGRQAWGEEVGAWSIAPFHGSDPYIRKEIKEKLRDLEQNISEVDFS